MTARDRIKYLGELVIAELNSDSGMSLKSNSHELHAGLMKAAVALIDWPDSREALGFDKVSDLERKLKSVEMDRDRYKRQKDEYEKVLADFYFLVKRAAQVK
jgi:hypothetical protein